jgi:hypothetical protein
MTVTIGPNRFGHVSTQLLHDLDMLAAKVSLDLERHGRIECPVDTGNLRDTTYATKLGPYHYEVRSDAEYAAAVHEGSDHGSYVIPSNPYLTRATHDILPAANAAAMQLQAKYT